ncbi:hypothetical protein DFJ58DRAFT_913111 [Suillus subalutaceus]|uniref:uncharacterized protein n=1 Tax=Suillus subalutaceus TaxID=48586 RepID=UPI001B884AE5|nr:uncharacterized protein DFJ58DRAFT_913111 [Suillus subalutaceus]KAG1859557.1 hypothetical protein DFJ58DRAFT_913111 [Suillus subalutaceus]
MTLFDIFRQLACPTKRTNSREDKISALGGVPDPNNMATPTVSRFVDTVFIRPIVVAISSLLIASLMSYVMAERLDWRPITVCVTCDILTVGIDHFKDQEIIIGACSAAVVKRFTPLFYLARMFLILNALLLVIALSQGSPKMTIITVVFTTPAFLWATPLNPRQIGAAFQRFIPAKHGQEVGYSSSISGAPFVIKRVPGMKSIFNGIIRGCGIFFVVHSALQESGKSNSNVHPWKIIEIVIWSTISRTGHGTYVTFARTRRLEFPTIPVLLGSPLKTRIVLTASQAVVIMACLGNPYILGSSCFMIALVWFLGQDSPKAYFILSIHSQSIFIVIRTPFFELVIVFNTIPSLDMFNVQSPDLVVP